MKICDDEEIIEMNHPKEVHNLPFDAITDYCVLIYRTMGAVTRSTCRQFWPICKMILILFFLWMVLRTVSPASKKTPAKRDTMGMKQSLPINVDNEDELRFSTNKFSRKGGKRQKMQISGSDN
nr:uncharacterized protein LOC112750805 [Arachis hypogaea]